MPTSLISSFCTSGQMFAAGFLQIPLRNGHPCPWLYTSRYRACYGLTPIRECSCWANDKKGGTADSQRRLFHFRPAQSSTGEKSSLPTPHSGHTQSSGISSKAVPGATPLSGSPAAGSYIYPHTLQMYFFISVTVLIKRCFRSERYKIVTKLHRPGTKYVMSLKSGKGQ